MTILGNHTLGELRDLLAARDYSFRQIASAVASSPPSDAAWLGDWDAFASRWTAYRAKVGEFVNAWHLAGDSTVVQNSDSQDLPDSAPTPPDVSDVFTDWWHETLFQGYPMQDLYRRLALLGRRVDFSATPQPTAPDADLNVFNALPDVGKAAAAAPASMWMLGGAVLAGALGVIIIKRVL